MGRRIRRELQRRSGHVTLAVLASLLFSSATFDLRTPDVVEWEPAQIAGFESSVAAGLVLQDQLDDTIFASMGYDLYRSTAGGPFVKVYSLIPEFGEAWAAFSTTFRSQFRYHEMVEALAIDAETLVALAGGHAYRIDLANGTHERAHSMRYYGRGEGRGLMPHGLTRDSAGVLYYGEYPTRKLVAGETVALWRSRDDGRTWEVAHTLPAGFARHIHAVQWDPFGEALWVTTGDRDEESRIGYSRDGGLTFTWIGSGDQRFRTCSLMFDETGVTWAMDAPQTDNRVLRFDRRTGAIDESETVLPGPGYYMQAVDAGGGLLTLAEREASVWWVGNGEPRELINWRVEPNPNLPHPSVRLLRSNARPSGSDDLLLNPLRTEADGAAIYRLSRQFRASGQQLAQAAR